uniref:Uncharacterized protein n=1 Tax=Romanomermis culicivorax TaxID=13658 RepID=A0A915KTD6_ROMCU
MSFTSFTCAMGDELQPTDNKIQNSMCFYEGSSMAVAHEKRVHFVARRRAFIGLFGLQFVRSSVTFDGDGYADDRGDQT